MNKLALVVALLWVAQNLFSQSLNVSFTTVPITSGVASQYSPRHILAVWVETSDGTFVSSLKVMARERIGYLTNWNSVSKANKVNAVTGATLTTHQTHSITWNCLKYNGSAISSGSYKLCIELTSGDATGTYSETPFTIGDNGFEQGTTTGTNVTGLALTYTGAATGIDYLGRFNNQNVASVYPNPFDNTFSINFFTAMPGKYRLILVNELGQTVLQSEGQSITGVNTCTLDVSKIGKKLLAGQYYCILKTNDYQTSVKIMKK
jgi:hypothetical protein